MKYIRESKDIKHAKEIDYLKRIGFNYGTDSFDNNYYTKKVGDIIFYITFNSFTSIDVRSIDNNFSSIEISDYFNEFEHIIEKQSSFITDVWFVILEQYETFNDFILPIIDYGCDPDETFLSYSSLENLVSIYTNIEVDENDINIKHLIERCEGLGLIFEPSTGEENYYLKFKWKQQK